MIDHAPLNANAPPKWAPGEPVLSWWTGGIKGSQYRDLLPTVTFRCPLCFYIESYAPPIKPKV